MGEVVTLKRLPTWGAHVELSPDPSQPGRARAELVTFWGRDGLETPDRLERFADALERAAHEMRAMAVQMTAALSPETDR